MSSLAAELLLDARARAVDPDRGPHVGYSDRSLALLIHARHGGLGPEGNVIPHPKPTCGRGSSRSRWGSEAMPSFRPDLLLRELIRESCYKY